jgi:hypothetical protein
LSGDAAGGSEQKDPLLKNKQWDKVLQSLSKMGMAVNFRK